MTSPLQERPASVANMWATLVLLACVILAGFYIVWDSTHPYRNMDCAELTERAQVLSMSVTGDMQSGTAGSKALTGDLHRFNEVVDYAKSHGCPVDGHVVLP